MRLHVSCELHGSHGRRLTQRLGIAQALEPRLALLLDPFVHVVPKPIAQHKLADQCRVGAGIGEVGRRMRWVGEELDQLVVRAEDREVERVILDGFLLSAIKQRGLDS